MCCVRGVVCFLRGAVCFPRGVGGAVCFPRGVTPSGWGVMLSGGVNTRNGGV